MKAKGRVVRHSTTMTIRDEDGKVKHEIEFEPQNVDVDLGDIRDDAWESFGRAFPGSSLDPEEFDARLRARRLAGQFSTQIRRFAELNALPPPDLQSQHQFSGDEFEIILWLAHRQLLVMQGARRSADARRLPESHKAFLDFLRSVPAERRRNLHGLRGLPGYIAHMKIRLATRRALLKKFNEEYT